MSIQIGITQYLSSYPGIQAIVGARVYWVRIPETPTFPLIKVQRISGPRMYSHTGPSGLAHPRFQVDSVAETYEAAAELAEQVRLAMGGVSGTWGPVTVGSSFVEDERDFYEDELGKFRIPTDVTIWHQEETS